MNQERLLKILLGRINSEKTMRAEMQGQYVFRVVPDAKKTEIKQAIEQLFTVNVSSVQVANVKGKTKRFAGRPGRRADWRKAYICLVPGQTINFVEDVS
jgi:large subunit ribosomal protein L23